ncbi:MAG: tetratricopeptide repeat protein [Candidatus Cloacimonetes bacterium]|nr:tetratricopeptide repeat protein [Candidatus Cloacimonadota bacterium]
MKYLIHSILLLIITSTILSQQASNSTKLKKLIENYQYSEAYDLVLSSKLNLKEIKNLKLSIELSNHMNHFKHVQKLLRALQEIDSKFSNPKNPYILWINSISLMRQGQFDKALKPLHQLHKYQGEFNKIITKSHIDTELGISYYKIGDYIQASLHLKRAITDNKSYKDEHTIRAKNYLANLYESQEKTEKSKKYFLEALDFYKDKKNYKSPIYAELLNDYGMSMYYDSPKEGLDFVLKGLNIRQYVYGNRHPMISESYGNLSLLYDETRDYEKAEDYALKAIKLELEINPNNAVAHVVQMDNLSQLYEGQQKWKESLKWLRKAASYFDNALSKESKHYITVAENLSAAYFRDNNVKQGLTILKETVFYEQKLIEKGHIDDGYIVNRLLRKLYELKRYDEAENIFINEIAFKKKFYGKEHKIVGESYESLGDKLLTLGQYQKALTHLENASKVIEKNHKSKGAYVTAIWLKIASAQIQMNDTPAAIKRLKQVEILLNDGLQNIVQQIGCYTLFCKAFIQTKEYSNALNYNQKLYDLVSVLNTQSPLNVTILTLERATILSLSQKFEEAETLYEKVKSDCKTHSHLEFSYDLSLAQHYERSNSYKLMFQHSSACFNFLELHNIRYKPINLIVLSMIGLSSSKLDKVDEAITHLNEALDLTEILDQIGTPEYIAIVQELLKLSKKTKDKEGIKKYSSLLENSKLIN